MLSEKELIHLPNVLLGDPFGLYRENDDGVHYLEVPKAIIISKQPNITFEESIEIIDHEFIHHIFSILFNGKENYDVNYGYDVLCFGDKEATSQ